MIISRWQAPKQPNLQQVKMLFEMENLEPIEEKIEPQTKIKEHRHPFGEVRIIVSGEMLFNISGNQFVLRSGDRVEIPANTKHSYSVQGEEACISICANKSL